ncbi:diguanylate cyclase domain-containing protein [Dendrosporobacter sp. 1207_IL3150]|uniref:diguanylate cyclase domain-containing protein n=1 Tax=Dendrosporobacter sp. 1207_IL3150 TaxID=3084054 RepID=UPI002FD95BF8
MTNKVSAIRISFIYAITGVGWILISDFIAGYMVSDYVLRGKLEVLKGWLFILVTTFVLYKLLSTNARRVEAIQEDLHKQNEELAATYEELYAAEEELRHQFDELLSQDSVINRRNECLSALHRAALILMQERNVDELLDIVVKKMMAITGADFGYIYLLDEKALVMRPKVVKGFPIESVKNSVNRGEGIIGAVWDSEDMVVIDNYPEWNSRLREPIYEGLQSGVGLPIKVGGQVIGVFSMNYIDKHVVDDEERRTLMSFSELASIALNNAHLNDALHKSQSRSQALIDALPDLIVRLDRQGTLLEFKKGSDFDLPFDINDKIGLQLDKFLPTLLANSYMEYLHQSFLTNTTNQFEYDVVINGRPQWHEARIKVCGTNEAIAIVRDITRQVETNQKLKYLGLYDKVTGLYNRTYFEDEMDKLNRNYQLPVSIIACDIDGLKLINDTLGHHAGDELLMNAATLIKNFFNKDDIVARVGGDEFAVLVFNRQAQDMERLCQELRNKVKQFRDKNTDIPISISIGLGLRAYPHQDIREVYKAADDNMYREKLHSSYSTRSALVHTLAKAMEVRDFVTDGHADRLQDLVVELAVAVGVSESKLPDLRLLGRFHDIGKVGIPDHILFKPGRLSEEEFEIMKRHSEIGYRIAQSSAELSPIADWILKHHEWWNGKGYPLGIQGEDIPIACRILAIVDAYDAITNDRPYRDALPHSAAISELERCSGSQFDPELVRIFKTIVK